MVSTTAPLVASAVAASTLAAVSEISTLALFNFVPAAVLIASACATVAVPAETTTPFAACASAIAAADAPIKLAAVSLITKLKSETFAAPYFDTREFA